MLHDFVRTYVERTRPRAMPLATDDHENSNASNFLIFYVRMKPMGLRSATLRAAVELRYKHLIKGKLRVFVPSLHIKMLL